MGKKFDRVEFFRQENRPIRQDDIKSLLDSAGSRYAKIRADEELLSGEYGAIVKHIKSFDDWEYFIDTFVSYAEQFCCSGMFNAVQVYKSGDTEIVTLMWQPNHDRHDKNTVVFGNCSFDDILNIEEIIRKRKEYYGKK
jgi:hypothetical protein